MTITLPGIRNKQSELASAPSHPHAEGLGAVVLQKLDQVELIVVELKVCLQKKTTTSVSFHFITRSKVCCSFINNTFLVFLRMLHKLGKKCCQTFKQQ